MKQARVLKQMIGLQKSMFENTFNTVSTIQGQSERVTAKFINRLQWMPSEVKNGINTAIQFCNKSREGFKNSVFENFSRLENFLPQE